MLSNEAARVDMVEVKTLSLVTDASSSSRSSGGLRRISIGLPRLNEEGRSSSSTSSSLSSFSDTRDLGTIESTVIRPSAYRGDRVLPRRLGGGMLVMASRAATDGGIESDECASRDLWVVDEALRFCASPWRDLDLCAVSCLDFGICTALVGVIERLNDDDLSTGSLCLPMAMASLMEGWQGTTGGLAGRSSFRDAGTPGL
jgi:hypothetical protein